MEIKDLAKKYALKNAVKFDGEANPGAVIGKVFGNLEGEDIDKGQVQQEAQEIVQKINSLSLEEQKKLKKEYEYEEKEKRTHDPLPDLDTNDEKVVLRFAPNPNGPPHLGSGRGMVINGELKQKYDGKLVLRFDDTDPVTKRPMKEAYEMYQEDYEWLGYDVDEVVYSSKNFDTYIEYAEKLIKKEKAYVCFCSQEEGQKYRKNGKNCPHRKKNPDKHLRNWEKMKNGGIEEGEATLKIKTNMQHKNPAVRDFVGFRIIENPDHPITGDEYRVWPLLDFQGAIEDHLIGTTHIVRGKDLRASTKRQKYIYNYLNWEYPNVRYWGRINVTGFDAPMSTSTMAEMIERGEIEDWSDVRLGTLRALRKRGFQAEALRNYFTDMGVTESFIESSIEQLATENRKIIEEKADRLFFVRNPIKLEIHNCPNNLSPKIRVHPDFEEKGYRTPKVKIKNGNTKVYIEENDLSNGTIRLKGLGNIKVNGKTGEYLDNDTEKAVNNDFNIVHWTPTSCDKAKLVMPSGDQVEGIIEHSDIEKGGLAQFERIGFVRRSKNMENTYHYTHD